MTIGELGCLILTDKWFGIGEHHMIINDAYPLLSTVKDVSQAGGIWSLDI